MKSKVCRSLAVLSCFAASALNAQAPAPKPDPDLVVNPTFAAVASQLDFNGQSFYFVELSKFVEGIQTFAVELSQNLDPSSPAKGVTEKVAKSAKILGFDQFQAYGSSMANRKDGRGQIKSYLKLAKFTGLYAQDGETRKPLRLVEWIPGTAGVACVSRWNPGNLWEKGFEVARVWLDADDRKRLAEGIADLKTEGVDLQALVDCLGREFAFAILLDGADKKTLPIPVPGTKFVTPRPGIMVLFEVKNDFIFRYIEKEAEKAGGLMEYDKSKDPEGWNVLRFEVAPLARPWVTPVIAQKDGVLIASLVAKDFDLALETRKSGKDFRTVQEYQKLVQGLPEGYQSLNFVSPILTNAIRELLAEATRAPEMPAEGRTAIAQFMKQVGGFPGVVTAQYWTEEGVLTLGRTGLAINPVYPPTTAPSAGAAVTGGAVLGAIAVPNFLEAKKRSQYSRARSDLRSMATAVESYFIDNNSYPPSTEDRTKMAFAPPAGTDRYTFFTRGAGLTTPVSYLSVYFRDPFSADEQTPYAYHNSGNGWILISPGPDGDFDLNWKQYNPNAKDLKEHLEAFANETYDPTNGTVSDGDVWRTKQ